jgi:hypothetical protein
VSDQLLQRIGELLSERARSTWEVDFLESLEAQVKAGKALSVKQMATLEEIERDDEE